MERERLSENVLARRGPEVGRHGRDSIGEELKERERKAKKIFTDLSFATPVYDISERGKEKKRRELCTQSRSHRRSDGLESD
jgi:hypothetical protein